MADETLNANYCGDCEDSAREYTTFLGMAVQSFDASLQYSGGGTSVTIRLYDDWCNCTCEETDKPSSYDCEQQCRQLLDVNGTTGMTIDEIEAFVSDCMAKNCGKDGAIKTDNQCGCSGNGNGDAIIQKVWSNSWNPNVFRGMDRYVKDIVTGEQLYYDEDKKKPVILKKLFDVRDCIGSPFRFKYGKFEFCGILQSLQPSESETGIVAWQAILKSPEEIVGGCQLILDGYHDDYLVQNVFNLCREIDLHKQQLQCRQYNSPTLVYPWQTFSPLMKQPTDPKEVAKYLPEYPFISLYLNEFIGKTIIGQMYYAELMWILQRICGNTSTGIKWRHFAPMECPDRIGNGTYLLDLSEMPGMINSHIEDVPEHYKIYGSQMSIADLVKQVCDEYRLDFFWDLIYALKPDSQRLEEEVQPSATEITQKCRDELTAAGKDHEPPEEIEKLMAECEANARGWAARKTATFEFAKKHGTYGVPVIKLRTAPKGKRSSVNIHSIEDTVQFLRKEVTDSSGDVIKPAYPINSYSSGIEETDELSSYLLTGANRQILIEATGGVINGWTHNYGAPNQEGGLSDNTNHPYMQLAELKKELMEAVEYYGNMVIDIAEKDEYGMIGYNVMEEVELGLTSWEMILAANVWINSKNYPELDDMWSELNALTDEIDKVQEKIDSGEGEVPMPVGTVWAMYFGQDRFNKPQVMIEDIYFDQYDWSATAPDDETGIAKPLKRPTMYRNAKVALDTFELKPTLRFYVDPAGSHYYDGQNVDGTPKQKFGTSIDWGEYTFPDYIVVTEEEMRASGNYALFWEMVVKMKGDLFKTFIEVLDDQVLHDLEGSAGDLAGSDSKNDIFGENLSGAADDATAKKSWVAQTIAYKSSSPTRPRANISVNGLIPPDDPACAGTDISDAEDAYILAVLSMIYDDLVNVAQWVQEITQQFYGKMFCTPFYFTENRMVYDSQGYPLYSYEPTSAGFRESGATDLLGLEIKEVLEEGVQGLEAFTDDRGMIQSFVRFWDPRIPLTGKPITFKSDKVYEAAEGDTSGYIPGYGKGTGVNQGSPEIVDGKMQVMHYIHQLDLSSFAPRDIIRSGKNGEWLYMPATQVQFIPKSNLVLIGLSSPIFLHNAKAGEGRYDINVDHILMSKEYKNMCAAKEKEYKAQKKKDDSGISDADLEAGAKKYIEDFKKSYLQTCSQKARMEGNVGGAQAFSRMMAEAARPVDGVYGAKCNFARYGPWSVSNGNGKAKFEKNTSLAPWTYSNKYLNATIAHVKMHERAIMQLAGLLSQQKWGHCSEQGQITFGGVPSIKLGMDLDDIQSSYEPSKENHRAILEVHQGEETEITYDAKMGLPICVEEKSASFFGLYGLLKAYTKDLRNYGLDNFADDLEYTTDLDEAMTEEGGDSETPSYYYWHLPLKTLGLASPVISRIEVNFSENGTVTTKYSINKETPRTGFLAKQFIEKIEAAHAMNQGDIARYSAERERELDQWSNNTARSTARDISDMGLTGDRVNGRIRAPYKTSMSRGQTFRDIFGKRAVSESPHNVIIGQMAPEVTQQSLDEGKPADKANPDSIAGAVVNFGDASQDLYHLLSTNKDYINKAFVSIDALLTPYATTNIQDAKLYEQDLQMRIRENQKSASGEGSTEAETQVPGAPTGGGTTTEGGGSGGTTGTTTGGGDPCKISQTPLVDNFLVPVFKKPKRVAPDTSKFSDLQSIKDYNETGQANSGTYQSVVLNSQYLNPLVNPKDVDSNVFASDQMVTKGESELGHNVNRISKGYVPPPDVNTTAMRLQGLNPYHPHYRALSLAGPLVLTGWGYNLNYQPIPRPYESANYFTKNFASRRDLWATGPVELLFDEDRGVWCAPQIKMHYVMMVEDMHLVDNTKQTRRDFSDYDDGYDEGETRGKKDKQTEISNLNKTADQQVELEKYDNDGMVKNGQAWADGHRTGYENGYNGITKPVRVMPIAKFSRGIAQIMDDPSGTVSYINVDILSDVKLQKGDYTMAIFNKGRWIAMPTGVSIRTGIVTRRIEPITYLDAPDEDTGEVLTGGGWIAELSQGATTNTQVKAFCGMVTTTEHSIPEGTFVQYLYLNGRAWIIGKHC